MQASRVAVLPPELASQIAAGEVVERPSSAVKELIENSLDAEASRVDVEIEGGGITRLAIADDGVGMNEADARLAIERHATSKLRSFAELTRVATFGFRGEALPTIASVSRFSLRTRERDSDRGVVYYAKADGSMIREAIFPLERPNGIGLSPDEKTLYVVETPTARVWAFRLSGPGQIESANGPYRGEKGTVIVGLGGYQMFDSLAVDAEGHVCVATLITGAVSDVWPDGSRVDQYTLPDMMVTNVCFGGPDLRTAYATLSMGGTLVSFEWPRPGLPLHHLNR